MIPVGDGEGRDRANETFPALYQQDERKDEKQVIDA